MTKFILSLFLSVVLAQTALPQMRIIYGIRQDGIENKYDSLVIYISKESMRLTRPVLVKEKQYIDFVNKQTVQILEGEKQNLYSYRKDYKESALEIVHEYPEVLGYPCLKSILNIRSNKIEVYYTSSTDYKGAPFLYLAEVPGLVLKIIRNGNYEVYAKQIDVSDDFTSPSSIPSQYYSVINESEFQRKLIESRYTTYDIFNNDTLSFSESFVNDFSKDIIKTSKGTVVLRKVNLPPVTNNTIVIAELTVRSNGDAYDRTGSVFAIPVSEKKNFLEAFKNGTDVLAGSKNGNFKGMILNDNYEPPVELVRFITSFGTGYFGKDINISGVNWKDSIVYRLEISDIIKSIKDKNELYIGTFIGTWDKGGHIISLRLKYFDEKDYENNTNLIIPLFNTLNYMEMEGLGYSNFFKTDTLSVTAEVPEGIKNAKLKFVTTGHGDDEFIPRLHKIFADDKEIFKTIPWRTDCASYRDNNPASGNFPNGMSSSDYSRSNWCPGVVVNPFEIKLDGLTSGKHTFKVIIECSENSYWNISGCLIAE